MLIAPLFALAKRGDLKPPQHQHVLISIENIKEKNMGLFDFFSKKKKAQKEEKKEAPKPAPVYNEPIILKRQDWVVYSGNRMIYQTICNMAAGIGMNAINNTQTVTVMGTYVDQFGNYYDTNRNLILFYMEGQGMAHFDAGPNVNQLQSSQISNGKANFNGGESPFSSNANQLNNTEATSVDEEYEVDTEEFNGIVIRTDISDVVLETNNGSEAIINLSASSFYGKCEKEVSTDDNGNLNIIFKINTQQNYSQNVNAKLTISLPCLCYELLDIKTSTGDINGELGAVTFSRYNLSTSTGDIELSCNTQIVGDSFLADSINVRTSTGDISTKISVVNQDNLFWTYNTVKISTSTGDISDTTIDGTNVTVESSTGDISIDCLRAQQATIKSSNGDIDVAFSGYTDATLNIQSNNGDINYSTYNVAQIISNGRATNTGEDGVTLYLNIN